MRFKNKYRIWVFIILLFSSLSNNNVGSNNQIDNHVNNLQLTQSENQPPKVLRVPQYQVITEAIASKSLDPWMIFSQPADGSWYSLVYSSLIRYDLESLSYQPRLARDWHTNEQGSIWTFTLRENVIFHDDSKFNATSILSEITRGKKLKQIGSLNSSNSVYSEFIDLIQNVTIHSEFQLSFYLTKPFSQFLPIIADLYFAAPSASVGSSVTMRIGSGPYIWDDSSSAVKWVLLRNENYFEGLPPFESVEMISVADNSQEKFMRLNELDLLPYHFTDFQQDDIKYIVHDTYVNGFGIFNTQNPILADTKVRRALNYAVNHGKINQVQEDLGKLDAIRYDMTFEGFRDQNYSVFPESANNAPVIENQFSFDLLEAGRLLDEAGYPLNVNNNRFNITIVSREDNFHVKLVEPTLESFAALGIGVNWEADVTTWFEKLNSLDFDIWVAGYAPSSVPDPFFMSDVVASYGVFNNGYYSNETLDFLYTNITETAIRNEQYNLYSQIGDHFFNDPPLLQLDSWGVIHPIREEFVGYVTVGYIYRLEFTYSNTSEIVSTSTKFDIDRTNVYSPRLDILILKGEELELDIFREISLSKFNDNYFVEGTEINAFQVTQLNTEVDPNYSMTIYLDPRSETKVDQVYIYEVKNNRLEQLTAERDKEIGSIKIQGSGDLVISLSIGKLTLESERLDPKLNNFQIYLIFTILSTLIVLGFAADYLRKSFGKYDGFNRNLDRYRLFLPKKKNVVLSALGGFLIASSFILIDKIVGSIGLLALQEEKNTKRPNVLVNGERFDEEKFSPQRKPKIRGKTLDLYYYIINHPGFHGVRELQRELSYSTPSLVYYHLNRLIKANTIKKNSEGKYGLPVVDRSNTEGVDQFKQYQKIISKTFLIGIAMISTFFSLILLSVFFSSVRIWTLIFGPIVLVISLFQFRKGFNLLWNMRAGQGDSLSTNSDYETIQNKIAIAISLKNSSRAKDLFEAQKILEEVLQLNNLGKELSIIALFNLCSILVDEMQIKQEEQILTEAEKLTERIIDLAEQMESQVMSVEALFIKSKFHLISGSFDDAIDCLIRAEEIAGNHKHLSKRVKTEYEKLQNEITKFEMMGTDISLSDKIERMKVQEYLAQVLKNLEN